MTGVGSFVFMALIKKWFASLSEEKNKFLRYFTFYLIAWVLMLGPSVVLLLLEKQHYSIGWVQNIYLDNIWFDASYHLALSFAYIFFVNFLQNWYWKVAPFFVILLSDYIVVNMNILIFHEGWNLFYLTLLRSLFLAFYILLEKNSLKTDTYTNNA